MSRAAFDRQVCVVSMNPFFEEGQQAYIDGKKAADCPYKFKIAGVPQETFDAEYRHKLDAWTRGWVAARDTK